MSKERRQLKVLALGDASDWSFANDQVADGDAVCYLRFEDLTPSRLEALAPDIVLTRLITTAFDVIDVARRLDEIGFAGRLAALAHTLPSPELVRQEVAAIAPGLEFDLFLLRRSPRGR